MKRLLLVLLLLVLVVGCQESGPVDMFTEDGVKISGDFLVGNGTLGSETAVILLHNLGGSKETYKNFANYLNTQGITTLAIDFRGHGGSEGNREDYSDYVLDVKAAKEFLDSKGYENIYLVGGSIGANVAFRFAAENDVKKVVLLTPGENYNGITVYDVVNDYTGELYMMVSERNGEELQFTWDLKERYRGNKKMRPEKTDLHGDLILKEENLGVYETMFWFLTR